VISAQKANTANAFSLPQLALSTANLYTAVQPGGSLFGLQESNPVNTDVAYGGNPANYGRPNDPMVGGRIGGVNVFGGAFSGHRVSVGDATSAPAHWPCSRPAIGENRAGASFGFDLPLIAYRDEFRYHGNIRFDSVVF
jgi:hypothetical protein